MRKPDNLTGNVYGRLTVLQLGSPDSGLVRWECLCLCGAKCLVKARHLKGGNTRSCGCLFLESQKIRNRNKATTHGHALSGRQSSEYKTWCWMKARCENPKVKCFKNYGGRGIKVCDRWRNSFANFLADMGTRPDGKSIDRIDVNGDYEPSNCRWATNSEQQKNKRKHCSES